MLERVAKMSDVAAYLAANHHGDAKRREKAAEIADEWHAFVSEIEENGVRDPLKVLKGTKLVVDGRHRRAGAIEGGVMLVPYIEVSEEEANKIIDGTVAGRRHWSKSAIAYFAVLRHPEVAKGKEGRPKKNSALNAEFLSAEKLGERFGVSTRLLQQAVELYQALEKKKTLRQRIEPSIWAGVGLGSLLSGLGGASSTAGKDRNPSNLNTVSQSLASFRSRIRNFDDWNEEQRIAFGDEWRETLHEMPATALQVIREALATINEEDAAE